MEAAIRKYGKDEFDITTLMCCESQLELNRYEFLLATALSAWSPVGYNLMAGDGAGSKTEETKRRSSLSKIGAPRDGLGRFLRTTPLVPPRGKDDYRRDPEYIRKCRDASINYWKSVAPEEKRKHILLLTTTSKSTPEERLAKRRNTIGPTYERKKHDRLWRLNRPTTDNVNWLW